MMSTGEMQLHIPRWLHKTTSDVVDGENFHASQLRFYFKAVITACTLVLLFLHV